MPTRDRLIFDQLIQSCPPSPPLAAPHDMAPLAAKTQATRPLTAPRGYAMIRVAPILACAGDPSLERATWKSKEGPCEDRQKVPYGPDRSLRPPQCPPFAFSPPGLPERP